jgi:hypothetical protein
MLRADEHVHSDLRRIGRPAAPGLAALRLAFMRSCGECASYTPLALRSQLQKAIAGSKIVPFSQALQVFWNVDTKDFRRQSEFPPRGADFSALGTIGTATNIQSDH